MKSDLYGTLDFVGRFLTKLLLVVVSIPAALLVIEGGLWLVFFGKDVPWGPGVKWYQQKYYVLNSGGYRDREHTQKKPDGTFRIIVLGDSFSFPANLKSLEDGWVFQLEKRLIEVGQHVEIVNLSKTGFNTQDQIDIVIDQGLSFTPDLVLVGYVLNDADPNRASHHLVPPLGNSFREEFGYLTQVAKKIVYDRNTEWLRSYLKLRSYGYSFLDIRGSAVLANIQQDRWFEQTTKALYEPSPFEQQKHHLARLVRVTKERKLPLRVVLFPYLYRLSDAPFAREHELVARVFEQEGVPVLDLYPVFSVYPEQELMLGWWDMHPNKNSHTIASEKIAGWLIGR